MELRHLRYFITAAEEENFRRAAERLHIVQPALSRQIAALERELGFELFAREKRRVKLTPAGKAYLADARRLLAEIRQAGEQAARVAKGEIGILRIGFHETAGRSRLVADSFRQFRLHYPNIELRLSQLTSPLQIGAIESGELDAGFVYLLQHLPPGFDRLLLTTDRFHVAVRRDHRLAAAKEIEAAELSSEPFVWIARSVNPLYYDTLIAGCRRAGLVPRIVQETQNEATTMNLVAVGMGAAVLLSATGESWLPDVAMIPIRDLALTMPMALVWKPGGGEVPTLHFVETVGHILEENSSR